MAGAAVVSAYFPASDGHALELAQRAAGYRKFTLFLDLRVTPVMYLAGLLIAIILAISLAMDTPLSPGRKDRSQGHQAPHLYLAGERPRPTRFARLRHHLWRR